MNNLFFLILFVPLLAFILLALNILLSIHRPDQAKVSAYECGLPIIAGQTRNTFSIQFYIIGMLFLVFDLELLLFIPYAVSASQISLFGFSIAIIFFIILTVGFILEIGTGTIRIISSDNSSSINPLLAELAC